MNTEYRVNAGSQILADQTQVGIARYRDELCMYLTQRFGSRPLAERIFGELETRLKDSDVLASVGNPLVYLCGFGLSLGMGFVKEELRVYPQIAAQRQGAGDAC